MCECIDSFIDPAVCRHYVKKSDILSNVKLETLPSIRAKDLLENVKNMIDDEDIIIIDLWNKISTKDILFYADPSDNMYCEYVIIMAFHDTLYKLLPNRELEMMIIDRINYITDENCYMRLHFSKNNFKILKIDL